MSNHDKYQVAVIGMGIYGRYLAKKLKDNGVNVVLIGNDTALHFRQSNNGVASLVNQARIHNGYHYPRSLTTAMKSVEHYQQFIDDFKPAVIDDFKQVYAIAKHGSMTNAQQFEKFCNDLNVKCEPYRPSFINQATVEKSWLTDEVAIDTKQMMNIMSEQTKDIDRIIDTVVSIDKKDKSFMIHTTDFKIEADFIFNCTYAGINNIERMITNDESKLTPVKFEACEIALFHLPEHVERIGLTVMDGPFVSFMPFTKTSWSLTSVIDTPHFWSNKLTGEKDIKRLSSQYDTMKQRLSLFVDKSIIDQMTYLSSEYVVKTIHSNAENDDNRLICVNTVTQGFVSILSGKLNAIYELDSLVESYMKGELC